MLLEGKGKKEGKEGEVSLFHLGTPWETLLKAVTRHKGGRAGKVRRCGLGAVWQAMGVHMKSPVSQPPPEDKRGWGRVGSGRQSQKAAKHKAWVEQAGGGRWGEGLPPAQARLSSGRGRKGRQGRSFCSKSLLRR